MKRSEAARRQFPPPSRHNRNTELLHLAESFTAAELWIAREGYRNARLEIVGTEDGDGAGGADLAA